MTAPFSVFRFPIVNSSKNSTEYTSCFIFLFDILKTTKLMKKKNSKEAADFPGIFGALTWRPGELTGMYSLSSKRLELNFHKEEG